MILNFFLFCGSLVFLDSDLTESGYNADPDQKNWFLVLAILSNTLHISKVGLIDYQILDTKITFYKFVFRQ